MANKYRKGRVIYSFRSLFLHLKKEHRVYLNGRLLHEGWVISLQVRTLKGYIDRKLARVALRIEDNKL